MGLLVVLNIFTGCSKIEPSTQKIIDTIIVKNNTGVHIQKITISEITQNSIGRHGSMSPVPVGLEQVFGRGDNVNRLADTLKVHWIDRYHRVYEKIISISSLLNSTPSNKSITIILEFSPYGTVKAYKKTN
jgi:hypothetical protein